MIRPAFNNAQVVYQIPLEDVANEAILIHRDNGGTLVLEQNDQQICIDLHRGNLKQIFAAIQKVLDAAEVEARKKSSK